MTQGKWGLTYISKIFLTGYLYFVAAVLGFFGIVFFFFFMSAPMHSSESGNQIFASCFGAIASAVIFIFSAKCNYKCKNIEYEIEQKECLCSAKQRNKLILTMVVNFFLAAALLFWAIALIVWDIIDKDIIWVPVPIFILGSIVSIVAAICEIPIIKLPVIPQNYGLNGEQVSITQHTYIQYKDNRLTYNLSDYVNVVLRYLLTACWAAALYLTFNCILIARDEWSGNLNLESYPYLSADENIVFIVTRFAILLAIIAAVGFLFFAVCAKCHSKTLAEIEKTAKYRGYFESEEIRRRIKRIMSVDILVAILLPIFLICLGFLLLDKSFLFMYLLVGIATEVAAIISAACKDAVVKLPVIPPSPYNPIPNNYPVYPWEMR